MWFSSNLRFPRPLPQFCQMLVGLSLALLGVALPLTVRAEDPDAPAADQPTDSLWDYIEGAPPQNSDVQATAELAAERFAELGFMGMVGSEPPVDYYLDPIGATAIDPFHLDKLNPAEFDIPVVVNDMVKQWMTYFLGSGRKYYTRYLARSSRWMPMMHQRLEERGMPKDLVYLSMIESGFNTGAYSYAAAVGLWQFMSGTGRDYHLRIDWWQDQRRDPEASTDAALAYLADLHKMFNGDWWLAWASYNGGQGRVMQATKRLGTTDFWKIVQADVLHPETENYVPKLIAAAIIGKHPERYGFVGIKYETAFAFDTVEVPASVSVDVLARCASMTEQEFLDYNPSILRFALPPDPEVQRIRVKKGNATLFQEAFAKIPPQERVTFARHVVKRGESLGSIARKYGVSTADISRVNRIGNSNHIYVGLELVIPTDSRSLASTVPTAEPAAAKPATAPKVTYYTVKSGDTLSRIAAKYDVTVAQVMTWNGLKSANSIQIGQKLKVQVVAGSAAPPAPAAAPATPKATSTPAAPAAPAAAPTTYTVKSGDSLSAIASRYGTTVDQLKAWNKLSSTNIQAGQTLIVKGGGSAAPATSAPKSSASPAPKSSSGPITYTVRRGDTLGSIADRYGCSVADLKSWNKLSNTTIYPGQKLKILK